MDTQKAWESEYAKDSPNNKNEFPYIEIVSFIRKNFTNKIAPQNRADIKILELGCGWGNNIKFIAKEGFSAYGLDFSKTAINHIKELAKDLDNLYPVFGDMLELSTIFEPQFDAIVDRAGMQTLANSKDIARTINEAYKVLKPNGMLFAMIFSQGVYTNLNITQDELKAALSVFKKCSIDTCKYTSDNQSKEHFGFIIQAVK